MSFVQGDDKSIQQALNAKKICGGLQSEDKRTRKNALIDLQKFLSDRNSLFNDQQLRSIFNETHIYTFNAFRDKTEAVREQAIKFMSYFLLEKLDINDYYLTYVFPVFVERIGTVELVEGSEEVRLQLVQFLHAIILKYSNTVHLKPFINDIVTVLSESVKDKHPDIKEISCKCITSLSLALPRDFHLQAENLVKPVLSAFCHQRYKIRVEAVKCMGDIIMHSSYKGLEEVVGPMAERLFDQVPAVRRAVAVVASRCLLEYRDRYSFFHKLLPLLLTGLNDEVPETRQEAFQLWQVVGLQYQKENEKDLKDQMDFLTEPPKYYPECLVRPNLGCRVLVQRNVGKLVGALARELSSWQSDVRVRCSQLLCAIVLHAESGLAQHLQDLLTAMYLAARDDDQRVVTNIVRASELMGWFLPVDTWQKLIFPAIEDGAHYGHLIVLTNLIKGSPQEYIAPFLQGICELLADNAICQSRKQKYQLELVNCVKTLLQKYKTDCDERVGRDLFVVLVTVIALRDPQNVCIHVDLLDDLYKTLEFDSKYQLWSKYTKDLLGTIKSDPKSWSVNTTDRCLFEIVLLESGQAFGENLFAIGNILANCLDIDSDSESRLKTFIALSVALERKDEVFRNAVDLNQFLEKLTADILVPSLVWHAGRTAEAMRTVAVSCLCSALNPGVDVDLFYSVEIVQSLFSKLLPLLLSLTEDAAYRSRQLALDALALLKQSTDRHGCWNNDSLIKIYPEILKRLDDPTDKVRVTAAQVLSTILKNPPPEFTNATFKAHRELIIDTVLIHFDDDEEDQFQTLIFDVLKIMGRTSKEDVLEKVNRHRPLLRNQKGCDNIIAYTEQLSI